MKKITIVTITYNDIENLKCTVESVLKEKTDEIEYIIIDGASTDGTGDFLKTLKDEEIVIISEPDNGIYNAMNKGIRMAEGQWIYFLNSGDYLLDGVIQRVLGTLSPEADCIYGDVYLSLIYDNKRYFKLEKASSSIEIEQLRKGMQCSHQAIFCKRDVLERMNGFDETFKTAADWELILRIKLQSYIFKYIGIPIAIYDKTGVSSKPHPVEKHNIRKKNHLFRFVDIRFLCDLLQAFSWCIIAAVLGKKKAQYQIKYKNYQDKIIKE